MNILQYFLHWKSCISTQKWIPHSTFSSSPFSWSSSTIPWLVSGASSTWGAFVSLVSPSQRTVPGFWFEHSRWRGCVLLSPGLNDWETPDPPLLKPSPCPWRDPSLRRPPEPERKAGDPGTEMSASVWDGALLKGEGETGALRGSGKSMTLVNIGWNQTGIHTQNNVHSCWIRNRGEA